MRKRKKVSILGWVFHRLGIVLGAAALTLAFFLVLPLMQSISKPPDLDTVLTTMDTTTLDKPDPVEEPEPEPEPEQKQPPKLDMQNAQPLSLQQLELALSPGGFGDGAFGGEFAVSLSNVAASSENAQELFSMADLDQKPRVIYQPGPKMSAKMRQKTPGTVYVIFIVDERGRVGKPNVQKSSDQIFERAALSAVRQWRFEPGKRNGKSVRFRMRVPITFPKT